MAKNRTSGNNQRRGAVKARSQIKNRITGTWTTREDKSGIHGREGGPKAVQGRAQEDVTRAERKTSACRRPPVGIG